MLGLSFLERPSDRTVSVILFAITCEGAGGKSCARVASVLMAKRIFLEGRVNERALCNECQRPIASEISQYGLYNILIHYYFEQGARAQADGRDAGGIGWGLDRPGRDVKKPG